ncbi:metallophosphoesterase [bacterium]|nr:metallophosphoesterase [bacterium]
MKHLLKIFLIFTALLFNNISTNAQQIKFVQIADAHYFGGINYRYNVLKSAIEDINKQNDLDFVVFTGDNIDRPKEKDLIEFIQIIKKLKKPYYIIIGNHDVYKANGLSKARYMEIVNGNNVFKKPSPNYVFCKNGFVFIVVDGAKEVIPGSNGYYKAETLNWLEKQLVKYKDEHVVILQHFPLIEPQPQRSHETYKAEEYLKILDKYDNVIAVISGHYHINGEKMRNGVYHISSPTLLNEPNSYKIIEISSTKEFSPMIYTRLREFPITEYKE